MSVNGSKIAELKADLKDAVGLLERVRIHEADRYCTHCGEFKTHALNCLIRDIDDWLWYFHSDGGDSKK